MLGRTETKKMGGGGGEGRWKDRECSKEKERNRVQEYTKMSLGNLLVFTPIQNNLKITPSNLTIIEYLFYLVLYELLKIV